jgi:DNA modification methylase
MHPTVKPVRMIADAMLDCSKPQSIVLDPFMGSGSTLLAGEMLGRHVYGLEIDPEYVDVSIRRWQAFTHRDAILESTGQTFEEVETERNSIPTQPPKKTRASHRGGRHG